MGDKLIDFLQGGNKTVTEQPSATGPSVIGRRESFMLDFEMVNGQRFALPYTSLLSLNLNPSTGLIANFGTHIITIKGLNLRAVYEALSTRSAGTLKAVSDRPATYPDGVPVVYSIELSDR